MNCLRSKQQSDRRRFDRRSLDLAVSFSIHSGTGPSTWYLGWIEDAGMGGIRVKSNHQLTVQPGCLLLVLCLAGTDCTSEVREPLVKIKGKLCWQAADGRTFGLNYV